MEFTFPNLLDIDFYPVSTSEDVLKMGCVFSHEQLQLIKYLQTQVAQDLVTLDIDPEHLQKSLQTQAALRGKLDAYRELLIRHTIASSAA